MKLRILILTAAILLASCSRENKQETRGPITRIDDVGHSVSLQRTPRRIVSLAPSITETLFALGLDSSIVGVTDYCDSPPAAKLKTSIGGMMNPDVERILALHPDLVLMSGSGNTKSDYEKLASAGVTVFVSYPRTLEGIFKSISDAGYLTSSTAHADSLLRLLRQRTEDLVCRAATQPKKSVLMLLSLSPIVAIGPGTFLDEMLTLANSDNIAHNAATAYPLLSREEILRRQPDVIIATNDIVHSTDDILSFYPEWKSLPAIRQKRVGIVDASIVSRPGPRIVNGLEALVHVLHPSR
ncbi:MAG: cobalamin-binding protein [Ignavibacteriales bacterium]|nr:cobalamin-binding protein [Ignavibacteriales bacterium]